MFRKLLLVIGILIIALGAAAYTTANAAANGAPKAASAASTASALTADEQADLSQMREEEKLARDVYLALYDKWDAQVFKNIARAEQVHMDAIGNLLSAYGIDDPVAKTDDARGVFTNPDLQALYDKLIEQGSGSLTDAFTVGATIEDLDIKDLNDALAHTDKADIKQVYESLKMGSENHLRAFMANLKAQSADYTPQYITDAEFQQILQSTNGRGHRNGNMGNGAGWGFGSGNGSGQGFAGNNANGQGFGGRFGRQGNAQRRGQGACLANPTPTP